MQNLTGEEIRSLRCVTGMMIPASVAHAVPGADDDTIFADIVASIRRDMALVKQALQHLDHLIGGVFADCDLTTRLNATCAFQKKGGTKLTTLNRVVVQCCYRDDRVMRSLSMDVRPPFPKGFEVEQGDWSLLDPVRAHPAFYRRTFV